MSHRRIGMSRDERPLGPILVVEDETSLADAIRYNLEREGFEAVVTGDGREGLQAFRSTSPSLVLLDLMLPGMPGLDLCRLIRIESSVPVVIITAKDAEADRVAGLEIGADDYVTKPFSMRELMSRVRAHLRRAGMSPPQSGGKMVVGPVEMDVERHEVRIDGREVDLPPKEFALLEIFLRRRGKLVGRDLLVSEVWGSDYFGDTRTLDVHVKRLRAKIEDDPRNPQVIKTVRGLGYKMDL